MASATSSVSLGRTAFLIRTSCSISGWSICRRPAVSTISTAFFFPASAQVGGLGHSDWIGSAVLAVNRDADPLAQDLELVHCGGDAAGRTRPTMPGVRFAAGV